MEAALNGPLGRTILEPTVLTIGSSLDNQLVLHSSNVAEHQAEIRPEGQGYSITDLGGANGTFVNGQRLDWNMPHLLNPGDSITIGDTTFTYEGDGTPLAHSSPGQMQAGQPQAGQMQAGQPQAGQPQQVGQPQAGQPQAGQPQAGQPQAGQPQGLSLPYAPPSPITGEHAGDADAFPYDASADWEHTAYGSGISEGMQPQQPYGQPYPQPPFAQPTYPGSMPSYPDSTSADAESAPPQAARRGRSWIWITLGVVVLLILGGAAYVFFTRPTPEKTLDTYCEALQAQNYVAAYNQLASSLQNTETEPQYAAISQALGKTTVCTHSSANIITNTATASLTLVSSGQTYNGIVTLLQDSSNNWKISILLSSPTMTLNTFCNSLKNGDYQSAYSELSSTLKSQHTETQFESDFANLTCSYSGISVSGINASAGAKFVNRIAGTTSNATITLSQDRESNNDWKINGIQ